MKIAIHRMGRIVTPSLIHSAEINEIELNQNLNPD